MPLYSEVRVRGKHCVAAERRVFEETGRHTLYAVNITNRPDKVLDNAKAVLEAGGNMVMVSHLPGEVSRKPPRSFQS